MFLVGKYECWLLCRVQFSTKIFFVYMVCHDTSKIHTKYFKILKPSGFFLKKAADTLYFYSYLNSTSNFKHPS